jgi:hypothetical protein
MHIDLCATQANRSRGDEPIAVEHADRPGGQVEARPSPFPGDIPFVDLHHAVVVELTGCDQLGNDPQIARR